MTRRYGVVGAGISGLTAAYRIRTVVGPDAEIVVFDPADRPGGVLRTETLGGQPFDIGAEAFLVRRPEVPALLAELGLADRQISPTGVRTTIYSGGRLHPLPAGTVNGIPGSPEPLAGLVDAATTATIGAEPRRPLDWQPGSDPAVGALVADRFGVQVVTRSVDPMLSGVYAGSAAGIGVRSAVPALAAALDAGATSLSAAVGAVLPASSTGPVFGAVDGGYRVLVDALQAAADIRLVQAAVTGIGADGGGWSVTDGAGRTWATDGVVVATSAPRAAALLAGPAPRAAELAARVQVASAAVLALAMPAATPFPPQSGVLVATGESLHCKAITLSSRKWGRHGDAELLRLSFGRFGDDLAGSSSEETLRRWAADDLAAVFGIAAEPLEILLHRWIDALPQYAPGHADLAAGIRAALPAGLAVAGNYLDGVGVPGCLVAAGRAAAGVTARESGADRGTIDPMARLDYDEINATIRYVMFSTFAARPGVLGYDDESRAAVTDEMTAFLKQQEDDGVVVRGLYDVAGMRADADFMIWTHAERLESLQRTYSDFRRSTALGRACTPVWSSVALHRPAEFNKSHVPAFLAGEEPGNYVCVYPFVRSLDWYLLPDDQRRKMLADHGMAARGYKDVRANTVPAFALGDYEWILAFEAPELHRIVDLMRDLRATEARLHVREEIPFYTGPRVGVEELVTRLP